MKNLLLPFFFFCAFNSQAGGFRWPLVEYDHAKIFLFNIDLEKESDFSWHIYERGVYASSKIGDGIPVPEESLKKIHAVLARGISELHLGLSKCYLPRHGIIYYDKEGNPVASFSICFECEKISFWDLDNGALKIEDTDKFNIDKAESQIKLLKKHISALDIPIYDKRDQYLDYLADNTDIENRGEMFMGLMENDSMSLNKYTIEDVKSWVVKIFHSSGLKETKETKITAGGDEWVYRQLSSKNSRFIFSFDEENPYLVEATIQDDNILLPNGTSVGMSSDDIIGTFPVYDGIAWPAMIEAKNDRLTIKYYFKNRTLYKIELQFSIV